MNSERHLNESTAIKTLKQLFQDEYQRQKGYPAGQKITKLYFPLRNFFSAFLSRLKEYADFKNWCRSNLNTHGHSQNRTRYFRHLQYNQI